MRLFAAVHESVSGTFETCRGALRMLELQHDRRDHTERGGRAQAIGTAA
jgi:hypothetical protein